MLKYVLVMSCAFSLVTCSMVVNAELHKFESEEEAHEFVIDLAQTIALEDYWAGEGGYGPESCTFYRPVNYAVSVQHCSGGCSWTVVTDIEWNSEDEIYEICIGETFEDVDGIKPYWKTTQSDACDYCNNGSPDPNPDWDPTPTTGITMILILCGWTRQTMMIARSWPGLHTTSFIGARRPLIPRTGTTPRGSS